MRDDVETWIPLPGYEDNYSISSLGRVLSVERRCRTVSEHGIESTRKVPKRLLAQHWCSTTGRLGVKVCVDGAPKVIHPHTAVLHAFIGPAPSRAHTAVFINGNPRDCALSNLKWTTSPRSTRQKNNALPPSKRPTKG